MTPSASPASASTRSNSGAGAGTNSSSNPNTRTQPSVGVCIPAHNEGSTIGEICARISESLMAGSDPLVSELVVIDDRSHDDTAANASQNGAQVIPVASILADFQPDRGKGNAMWKGIAATSSDIIVFCDGDLLEFDPSYIERLAAKLLENEQLALVKGYYERGYEGRPGEGGRTTALMARPALSLFFPELADIRQPLGGEYAIRREVAEQVSFVSGWGVEMALLIDIAAQRGAAAIGQVELGRRTHKHRSLDELSIQASEILHIVLNRAGVAWQDSWSHLLRRPGHPDLAVQLEERPPLCQTAQYRDQAATAA